MRRFPFDRCLCLLTALAGSAGAHSVLPPHAAAQDLIPLISADQTSASIGDWSAIASGEPILVADAGTSRAPAGRPEQTGWLSNTNSAGQRPIEVARAGSGPQHILIIGSIYGNEPESITLLDATLQMMRAVPPPSQLTLLLVRTPNPDGVVEHIGTNGRGVDLNRNFPSAEFTLAPNRLTGPHPGSEPEVQYMQRILDEYKPVRVIHIRSNIGERPLVLLNDNWSANGMDSALPQDVKFGRFAGAFKAGSLEDYVTTQLKLPLATVQLPIQGKRQVQSAELLRFATAHLAPVKGGQDFAQQKQPSRQSSQMRHSDGLKGDVELLPPPRGSGMTPVSTTVSQPAPSRYEELPPPPRK